MQIGAAHFVGAIAVFSGVVSRQPFLKKLLKIDTYPPPLYPSLFEV